MNNATQCPHCQGSLFRNATHCFWCKQALPEVKLNTLVAACLMTELDYMTADEAARALALETELVADAKAGVDLRVRLIGEAVSK